MNKPVIIKPRNEDEQAIPIPKVEPLSPAQIISKKLMGSSLDTIQGNNQEALSRFSVPDARLPKASSSGTQTMEERTAAMRAKLGIGSLLGNIQGKKEK